MAENKETPDVLIEQSGDKTQCKSSKNLPMQQKRLLNYLLKCDTPQSVVDFSVALHQADPRGHIRQLRLKGYPISDIWCKSRYDGRYKRYYLRKEAQDE